MNDNKGTIKSWKDLEEPKVQLESQFEKAPYYTI